MLVFKQSKSCLDDSKKWLQIPFFQHWSHTVCVLKLGFEPSKYSFLTKKKHIYIQMQNWRKNNGQSTKKWRRVHGFGVLTSRFLKASKYVCAMFYFIFKFQKKRGPHWNLGQKVRSPDPIHIIRKLWTFVIPNPWYFWCQVCDAGVRMAPNNVSGSVRRIAYSSTQYCCWDDMTDYKIKCVNIYYNI